MVAVRRPVVALRRVLAVVDRLVADAEIVTTISRRAAAVVVRRRHEASRSRVR